MTPRGYVIRHPEHGLFVGLAMGMGFFTLLDPVAQNTVVCFPTLEDAQSFAVACWPPEQSVLDHTKFVYHEVDRDWCGEYATLDSLRNAGLGPYLGEMGWHQIVTTDQVGRA